MLNDDVSEIVHEAKKRYNCKRLQEAFCFLKTLSYDGTVSLEQCSKPHNDYDKGYDVKIKSTVNSAPGLDQSFPIVKCKTEKKSHFQKDQCIRQQLFVESRNDQKDISQTFKQFTELNQYQWFVFTQNGLPYESFSVIPFHGKSGAVIFQERCNSVINNVFVENLDLENKKEVSFSHLLVPEVCKQKNDWQQAMFEGIHHLNPHEDRVLFSEKQRTVLNLLSYKVSLIHYVKPSEMKKRINERFKEKFPLVTITLTKLRSLKCEAIEIGRKVNADDAVISTAFIYFEKVVVKTQITKINRKYIAGACILLAVKFFDDTKNVKLHIQVICERFRLIPRHLLTCEIQLLILLEFALMTPLYEVNPPIKRPQLTN